jgi:hypothetical protein
MRNVALYSCALWIAAVGSAQTIDQSAAASVQFSKGELKEFTALRPIDVHTHILQNAPIFNEMLQRLNLHTLDILVVAGTDATSYRAAEPQRQIAWQYVLSSKGRASLSTTFDPFEFDDADFPGSVIESLNRDFTRGAAGVTIWTGVGAEVKDRSGQRVMPDNPRLEPIYRDMAAHNKTLIAHIGGSDEAYAPNPTAKVPAVLDSRDQIIAKNPTLKVVGAHFGSTKENLDQLSRRLEKYPNFAVDTSSRMEYLMMQPREKVIAFLLKFQDRILYGSDTWLRAADDPAEVVAKLGSRYAVDWRYLSTNDTFEHGGVQVHGLHLSQAVLSKIYHQNAVQWIPGIAH